MHTQNKRDYFLSQPHQPFFATGIFAAIVLMFLFLLDYKGVLTFTVSANTFHAYGLLFIVFTAFFQGFLLTTFPRFSQMQPIAQSVYLKNFAFLLTGALLFITGALFWIPLLFAGMAALLGNQIYTWRILYNLYHTSTTNDKHDHFWILTAFGSGVLSNILFIIALLSDLDWLASLAKNTGVYLYLVFLALSVGQRMIPFFSHVIISRNEHILKYTFMLFSLAVVVNITPYKLGFIFLFSAGILLAREIYRWKLPFQKAEPILWILHLAIFWLPAALILGSLLDISALLLGKDFIYPGIHLVVLGFVTTVLIGFGTRVTLGHSGNIMVTDVQTKMLFYMTQLVVYMRILYSLTGTYFLFDITIVLWLALFIGWSVKYMPALLFGRKIREK